MCGCGVWTDVHAVEETRTDLGFCVVNNFLKKVIVIKGRRFVSMYVPDTIQF